jgi:ubiquinone/menaquinone biosynthesis C-methylase UbiE
MVWSSKVGKKREIQKLLDAYPWRGDETVLDVGPGRGLLLISAAKRLTTGKAIGVDIWQSEDQSDNRPNNTWRNARAEGVAKRIELKDGDARKLPFENSSFDVVVCSLTLHNIYNPDERAKAVHEIDRVLKPGGHALILDFQHTGQYEQVLRDAGWRDIRRTGPHLGMFPPVRWVTGTKPE